MSKEHVIGLFTVVVWKSKITFGTMLRDFAPFSNPSRNQLLLLPVVGVTFYNWIDCAAHIELFGIYVYVRLTL